MKKKFLKDLELKLNLLEDDERKDIIDEYNDIIDEKVKHGKTEEEAIKDFGDFDALVKEILGAYKIKYNNKESVSSDDFFAKANELIKEGASIVVEFFKKLGKDLEDHDFKTEEVVEIIIKSIVVILILMVPFNILKWILHVVSNTILIYPLNRILNIIFDIAIGAVYFISIILIISKFFKDGYTKPVVKKETTKPKKEVKGKKTTKEETIKEEKIVVKSNKLTDIIMIIVKVIIILWTLPLIMLNVLSYITLSVLIYFLIKGVYIIGLVVLVAGSAFLLSHLLGSIYKLINNNGRVYFYPFIIYLMMIALGFVMTFDYVINVKKVDTLPGEYVLTTDKIEKTLDSDTTLDINKFDYSDIIIDETLLDDKIVFEITYSKDFVSYNINDYKNELGVSYYHINADVKDRNYGLINSFIEDLKNKELSNYSRLFELDVKVYANSKTVEKIKL